MLIEFPHNVEFSNHNSISVADVANSLLANEQILLEIGRVIECIYPGVTVEKINVTFKSASTNSPLKETMSAGIITVYQEKLGVKIPDMIEHLTGIHVGKEYDTIVSVIFIALVLYGMEVAWKIVRRKSPNNPDSTSQITINGNYNTVLQVAADTAKVEPHIIDDAVRRAFSAKQATHLATKALQFIRPAKKEKGAGIEAGGVTIDPEAVEASPHDFEMEHAQADEQSIPYERQKIVIHATDLDSVKRGWAGHIIGVWEKRLKMVLFPGIPTSAVFGKEAIVADIILLSRVDEGGNVVPYMFHVLKVYEED